MQLNTTDHGLCDTFAEFSDSNTQVVCGIFHYLSVHVFTGLASLENQNVLLPALWLYFIVHQGNSRAISRGNQESQRTCSS